MNTNKNKKPTSKQPKKNLKKVSEIHNKKQNSLNN